MTAPQGPGAGFAPATGSTPSAGPSESGANPYDTATGPYTSRDQALQQEMVNAGYDPNDPGFFQMFENLKARAAGRANADEAAQAESERLSQEANYRSGLDSSDSDYMGFDHEQMKQMVTTVEPGQVSEVSTAWTELANAMAIFGEELNKAANNSNATWKGAAAESAFGFVSGLGKWSDDTGQAAQLAADRVFSQSQAGESAKNSMPEPVPFSWDTEMQKWGAAGGLGLATAVSDSVKAYEASNEAHAEAARVMSTYDNELYGAASQTPAFAQPPTFGQGGGDYSHSITPVDPGAGTGTTPASTNPSGYSGGTGSSGSTSSSGTSGTGTGGPQPTLPVGVPRPLPKGPGTGSGWVPPGPTVPAGNRQGPLPSGPVGQGNSNMNGPGAMPMTGAMGPMGGGGGSEARSGRGFGPGGSAGSGQGAASGAAKPGGIGAAEAAAGRGGGGAGAAGAARAGGMGAGMAGAGGNKGQGGEDSEHNRPAYLVEGDPDEVFGNNERTAPPVIGE